MSMVVRSLDKAVSLAESVSTIGSLSDEVECLHWRLGSLRYMWAQELTLANRVAQLSSDTAIADMRRGVWHLQQMRIIRDTCGLETTSPLIKVVVWSDTHLLGMAYEG